MSKKTVNSRNIDKSTAMNVASAILEALDDMPMELSLSALNGVVIAMVKYVKDIQENAALSEEDGLEKLIYSWLSALDVYMGTKFSRFISPEVIHIDEDEL